MTDWIEHKGDGMPTMKRVDVRHRDGKECQDVSPDMVSECWKHVKDFPHLSDIVAYRIHGEKQESALDVQVNGTHYKKLKIQPIEYAHANNLDCFQFNIVRYATRHKDKGGADDLRKLIHTAQLALELQYDKG